MPVELTVQDFTFDGELGCDGATIEKVGTNRFRIVPGAAPEHPEWSNKVQFTILQNAKGNSLRLDVAYPQGEGMWLNEYFSSYSYDGRNWHPVEWEKGYQESPKEDTLLFPVFQEDQVYVGHQLPMSYEDTVRLTEEWQKSPHVTVCTLGESLGGRPIYRLEITDAGSDVPRAQRWVHHISNQHPGEHCAHWRMAGMVDWLLSAEGADCLRRSVCHFIFYMSPDAPSNGWYRVNAQGVDMNRSYFADGADPDMQAHEACLCQRDLEELMASEAPVTNMWGMHTWGGIVEPIITPGPEYGTLLGPWEELRDTMIRLDKRRLIKPLKAREASGKTVYWTAGPRTQFGITAVLCEGASVIHTREDNEYTGRAIMQSLAEFYKGTRG